MCSFDLVAPEVYIVHHVVCCSVECCRCVSSLFLNWQCNWGLPGSVHHRSPQTIRLHTCRLLATLKHLSHFPMKQFMVNKTFVKFWRLKNGKGLRLGKYFSTENTSPVFFNILHVRPLPGITFLRKKL